MDVIHVVGGGVIGLLTARELLQAGYQVELLERGEVGRESSWAGGGILSPLFPWRYPRALDPLVAWSQKCYSNLADQLRTETGMDPEHSVSGMLMVGVEDGPAAAQWAGHYAAAVDCAPAEWLQQMEPNLVGDLQPGLQTPPGSLLWMPRVAQIRNPRLLRALVVDIERRGGTIHRNQPVNGFRIKNGQVTGLFCHGSTIDCQCVVVCAGAWSGVLLSEISARAIPVEPVRGQMLLLKAQPDQVRCVVLSTDGYLIPRQDGRILVGSTTERTDFDKQVTQEARELLHRVALGLIPELGDAPIEGHWAGLRPGSPDDLPFIGAHPETAGLYVCAGHYRNGLVTAPASARLIADLVLDRSPVVDQNPYRLARPG